MSVAAVAQGAAVGTPHTHFTFGPAHAGVLTQVDV